MKERTYICIDLKSFYASVECVERGYDPMTVNLVVADPTRTEKTICLAISPAMKKLGVKNRCRLFEIPKNIKYEIAKPRMKLYMEKSAEIVSIYLRYISKDDIHVYSIDECFIDVTDYIKLYNKSAKDIAKMLLDAVFIETGITATVGIGTNLFLAKVALDITAKHAKDYMGFLNTALFYKTIWTHRPITDIWNIGKGIAKRLEKYGIFDLKGVANFDEKILYRDFGVNAELLIDHANGIEPCTISDIHEYRSKSMSISNGQVLSRGYTFDECKLIVKEMAEQSVLELVDRKLITDNISLYILYNKNVIKGTGGSFKINERTNSRKKLLKYVIDYYNKTTDKNTLIKRITIGFNNLVDENYKTIDFFTDLESEEKENNLLKTVIDIKNKFGKNAILKGHSLEDCSTEKERNNMIGGHNSGEDD